MLADTSKSRPGKTSTFVRPKDADISNVDIAEIVSNEGMNRNFDFYQVAAAACEKQVIRLQVPETLLSVDSTAVFLYTDSSGVLRSLKGPT